MPDSHNILVVGFGLAGAAVAAHLEKRKADYTVITSPSKSSSSRVAAGMFNPIVFRRLLKTWMADTILPYAETFYRKLEEKLNAEFYHPVQYYKLFGKEEAEFWEKRSRSEDTKPYLSQNLLNDLNQNYLKTPFGAGEVFGAGYVDINTYLDAFGHYLKSSGKLIIDDLDYSEIELKERNAHFRDKVYDRVIFCEGSHAIHNPWFSDLPFKLTKGEVLTIESELDMDFAVNKNGFVLPLGNHRYRVGATYEWKDLTEEPTEEGRETLVGKFKAISDAEFSIIEHNAGIRPTLANRRPVYQIHGIYRQLAVFNGLGTKGVMLAPYFANELVKSL
ncbi:NAD(P)/FAD-dependent oxidoreductase [Saccharicrinis sp. FJH62]|uniref:NAD(P)/FAD-dependent oxidoreductase n=1 Tax=Saccharicrinis sp. FJH62 TaxID=3344657 RepID=UPI0035D42889